MNGRSSVCVLLSYLIRVTAAGSFSGDDESYRPQHDNTVPAAPVYQQVGSKGLEHSAVFHAQSRARIAKLIPSTLLDSRFRQIPQDHSGVNFLARTGHEVHVENTPISTHHIIIMALQVDVRRLNVTLLQLFREGVATALDISPSQVHINRLNEQKNGIELYVSSDRMGTSEPVSSEEVIRSLNINSLHHSLRRFGITEVSSEKNVLQGQHERDNLWNKEGFYAVVIFFTIFVIIITCLMVLYRLKEKVEYSDSQLKGPSVLSQDIHLAPVAVHEAQPPLSQTSSMVQATPTLKPACTTITSGAPTTTLSHNPSILHTHATTTVSVPHSAPYPVVPDIKPCLSSSPSPFKMKPAGLQERRGSNVSLVLDMSALGSVEPLNCGEKTPRERAAQEYLRSAGRALSRQQLRDVTLSTQALQAEFAEIPMNFVDPKDLDIPSHGTKNRYKTILPNPHSRVILKSKSSCDPFSSYINANYIRGYLGDENAYIATQGPMINTVNDFWQMAWQEDSPLIVMITKLKEKNEKCVLYWPEKRGIYGKVEVLVNSIRDCEHYTVRTLTLKHGGQSRKVHHYWYTSWPDHKTPDSAGPLLQLMTDVEETREASGSYGPVIVHCSAGIGRTGCFIATTIGCRQLRMEGVVDVLSIICQLRADRGGMIQTGEQYEFVHHALSLYESRLSANTHQ
ncbi:receptor-type tyrosine-protein phosphatase R isoform X1 [Astyanax mexicanus]|uniref:receptor-type tyrosine-protein phosphatase R isoform X1 n=1 Tax=Astyanax mexicanus TaxID=7994 RepID=UPI0020CB68A2|nr:receptor-type tyrosine-protein phosphatase R isoform X1 [Astyanax mexicanus]